MLGGYRCSRGCRWRPDRARGRPARRTHRPCPAIGAPRSDRLKNRCRCGRSARPRRPRRAPSERSAARCCRRSTPSSGGRWAGWLRSWHIPAGRGSPRRSTIRDSPARVAGIPPAPQRAGSTTWRPTPRGSLFLFSFFVPFIYRAANHSTSRRFRKACVMVSSSTYSSSSPKPMPRAIEVTFTPGNCRRRFIR